MVSTSFIEHASHVFFGSLGLALLIGLARSAAPRLTRGQRVARLGGVPLMYFALLTGVSYAASFAPPTFASAMAVALVSPVSRAIAVRKLGALIRENEKTERAVEGLVALDLSIHDCRTAESDAYRYRARATWPKVNQACGPSESAARALFEDGRLEEAALAFESARKERPGAWMAIDELTAYVLTKRSSAAGAGLRAIDPRRLYVDDLKCLADAVEVYAGLSTKWGPGAGSYECDVLREEFGPKSAQPPPPWYGVPDPVAPTTCVPHRYHRDTKSQELAKRHGYGYGAENYPFHPELAPFASEAADPSSRVSWLIQIDDYQGALDVADRELRRFTWNAPLYPEVLRKEHEALMASAESEDRGNLWIRADCSKEIRVPAQHPLAKRVAKDRELYDAQRDDTDRGNLWARDEATQWAYKIALLALDGVRAQAYWTRHSRAFMPGELITPTPEASISLLVTFSSASAAVAVDRRDTALRDAAIAGSGTRLASRLRALDASGVGTLDVVGKTIPEGRAALQSFSRYDARLDCDRRTNPMDQRAPRCTALALVRALGVRHRVARAVGDIVTIRESQESLDRLLGHQNGAWLRDKRFTVLFDQADRMLTVPEGERLRD